MKKNFSQFIIGFKSYGTALTFIFQNGLWYYFIFPLLLNLAVFVGGISLINSATDFSIEWVMNQFNSLNSTGFWGTVLEWSRDSLGWLVWIVFKIAFFYVFLLFGGYISLIILSPVLALLSEKTEEIITGKKHPFNILQFTRDIVRAIIIVLRNMLIQILWVILFFIISFLPVIGWFISFFGNLIISSYFYGFSFMDYTNERRRLNIKQSVLHIKENKGLATGTGSVFVLCFLIPFLGSIIASFVSIIAVVGATLCMVQQEKAEKFEIISPKEINI